MMRTLLNARRHLIALRALLVFTVLLGLVYPLALVLVAKLPGLSAKADGSLITSRGQKVASSLIGQSFTTPTSTGMSGTPIAKYFQSRPSAAGTGYDPTASSASNLGPSDVVDTTARQSLLTQVCSRSLAIGALDGVDGRRPYCTSTGVGAVLGVWRSHGLTGKVTRAVSLNQTAGAPFLTTYKGVAVELAVKGRTYTGDVVTPIRGDAPAHPAVPADAVTSSGSGLDPDISVAYADIQINRVARARGVSRHDVATVVEKYTQSRTLGFIGEARVNVVELNLALDRLYPR